MKITLDQLLSEEHRMVRETPASLRTGNWDPLPAKSTKRNAFPSEVYKKAGEYGLIGSTSPVEYGGGGADVLTNALIKEEFCRVASRLRHVREHVHDQFLLPHFQVRNGRARRSVIFPRSSEATTWPPFA